MRWYRLGIAIALAFGIASGCATATKSGNNPDASNGQRDSSGMQFLDAPMNQQKDAPNMGGPDSAQAITLTETTNDTINYGGSIACGDNTTGSTRDNIWYRAFQLSDFPAITGGMHITGVNFLVQDALASLAITIKIGSYSGTLGGATINTAQITSLTQATVTPPDTSGMTGEMVNVPMTADIPAGGKFVIQIVAPDMDGNPLTQRALYIGTSASAETHPGYWSTSVSACGPSTPETLTAAGATGHVVIDVVGTH